MVGMLGLGQLAFAGRFERDMALFDGPLDGLLGVENIFLYKLERPRSVTELVVELIGQSGFLEHTLALRETGIDVAHILEDVLAHQFVPARPLLNLRLQQIAGFTSLQLLGLLVEGRWGFQRRHDTLGDQLVVGSPQHELDFEGLFVAIHGLLERGVVDVHLLRGGWIAALRHVLDVCLR